MSIIVIGGHSRSVGKTSVVAGLISALPDFHWTALKITQYGHGICSANGEACDCATADHAWAVSEERNRSGESDTSRFLVAGAHHSWWIRTEQGRLAEAMPRVRQILNKTQNTIIESNSVLRFLKPDLYRRLQDIRADVPGSRRRCTASHGGRLAHSRLGAGFPQTSSGPPNFYDPTTAVCHARDRGLRPRTRKDGLRLSLRTLRLGAVKCFFLSHVHPNHAFNRAPAHRAKRIVPREHNAVHLGTVISFSCVIRSFECAHLACVLL